MVVTVRAAILLVLGQLLVLQHNRVTAQQPSAADSVLDVPVQTSVGTIVGRLDRQTHVEAFKGIPYAEPPVGQLRFAPAAAKSPFAASYRAQLYGKPCLQPADGLYGAAADEDCLFLNIWRPQRTGTAAPLLPVLFWIHGGPIQK